MPGVGKSVVPTTVYFGNIGAASSGVDMPLHDMAVQAAVHLHGSFQVDNRARLPVLEIGALERFIDRSDGMGFPILSNDGQAHAVVCQALIDLKQIGDGGGDGEVQVGPFFFNMSDRTEGLYDTCKHNCKTFTLRTNFVLKVKSFAVYP